MLGLLTNAEVEGPLVKWRDDLTCLFAHHVYLVPIGLVVALTLTDAGSDVFLQ